MLIAVDIGNSALKAGLFLPDGLSTGRLEFAGASGPGPMVRMIEEIVSSSGGGRPDSAVVASVVPEALGALVEAVRSMTGSEPLVLTHETECGLRFDLDDPSTLGADRIASAAGAVEALGAPVAIVDFGTATTVGFVFEGETPEYAVFGGGVIMPGPGIMARALSGGTAQLPEVDLGGKFSALGKNTVENILAGIMLGTAGAVERIISEVEKSEAVGFQLAVTGGMAPLVLPGLQRPCALVEPDLTLHGLRAVHERNA